jgi:hypothetical protein
MSHETNKVMELPILKHFGTNEISLNPQNWRKGEKGIASIVGLVIFGTVAWGLYSFILPIVFTWIGKTLGAIAVAVLVIGFFILLPVIIKGFKKLARTMHKMLIRYDPFAELEEQKEKMIQNRNQFKTAKAKIKAIKSNMEAESVKSEKEAKDYQEKVVLLQERAESIKTKMLEMEAKLGSEKAKESDEFVEYQTGMMKTLSEAQRISQMLNQSTGLVRKYGSRAHVIGKLDRKLNMVDTAMEIKIADFNVSVDMLKKEFAFAAAAKQATQEAKSAMLFTKGWDNIQQTVMNYMQNWINLQIRLKRITIKFPNLNITKTPIINFLMKTKGKAKDLEIYLNKIKRQYYEMVKTYVLI